ncbi:hypothetical protein HRbin27_00001 [bacterium HR27]|nr:hypothetical protein HRbin27_00001 [bacterium HR27]
MPLRSVTACQVIVTRPLPATAVTPLGAGGGVRSTVQVQVAGVGSAVPLGLIAQTEKVWSPSLSMSSVRGLVQAIGVLLSSWHWKVAVGSSAMKLNVASVRFVTAAGVPVRVVSGVARAISHA